MIESVRIDKYLWSVRLCKTRNIAKEECEKRRVLINGVVAKPARHVKVGDKISIKKKYISYDYDILELIGKRQPASLVKNFIVNTTSKEKLDLAKKKRIAADAMNSRGGGGRPTKKDRRDMEKKMRKYRV